MFLVNYLFIILVGTDADEYADHVQIECVGRLYPD